MIHGILNALAGQRFRPPGSGWQIRGWLAAQTIGRGDRGAGRQVRLARSEPRELTRRELPILTGSINAECESCSSSIYDSRIWSGGPVDCPSCGAGYLFRLTREPERPFNPGVAAVLSLVIPGAGQMYRGRIGVGLSWLVAVGALYATMLWLLAIPLHITCMFGAASRAKLL